MKSPVEVKICGLTSEADAGLLEKYGADYGGMVLFYPKCKRNISLELAGLLVRRLKKSDINTVAVVVSPNVSQVTEIENIGFDYIQIHGNLSEEVYNSCGINIIRAVNIRNEEADEIQELLDCYLMQAYLGAVKPLTGTVLRELIHQGKSSFLREDLIQQMYSMQSGQ